MAGPSHQILSIGFPKFLLGREPFEGAGNPPGGLPNWGQNVIIGRHLLLLPGTSRSRVLSLKFLKVALFYPDSGGGR
jgi:hypothetical protein